MKSGNITLIGPTNSGKSSLINQIIGKRVSLVSRKKQSTIFNQKVSKKISENEFIIQDTPGFFSSKKKIKNNVISSPFAEIEMSNIIFVVIDVSLRSNQNYKKIIQSLKEIIYKQKIFLILNKIDKIKKELLLKAIKYYSSEKIFDEIFPVSSLTGEGIDNLLEHSKKFTSKNIKKYQSKTPMNIKKKLFYAEVTREKILDKVHKEIPYQCRVITEKITKFESQIKIHQSIEVRRKSHKNIIIGNKGLMLKEIGLASRKEIAKYENKKIHLFLFVKLNSNKS
tara:strand:- start:2277 stop:3122 length:846 start_codon:yes stop_codon:yes gene_type:complete